MLGDCFGFGVGVICGKVVFIVFYMLLFVHLYMRMMTCRILDNLPVGMVKIKQDKDKEVKTYERGFPVGKKEVCVHGWLMAGGV